MLSRLGRAPQNHNERCTSRAEAAIAAESEDGRRRVEVAYGRIAETEARRQETAARGVAPTETTAPAEPSAARAPPAPAEPPVEEFPPPPAAVERWFIGDGRQWAASQQSGLTRGRHATWRRKYLDARMKDMRGEVQATRPSREDEPEVRRAPNADEVQELKHRRGAESTARSSRRQSDTWLQMLKDRSQLSSEGHRASVGVAMVTSAAGI